MDGGRPRDRVDIAGDDTMCRTEDERGRGQSEGRVEHGRRRSARQGAGGAGMHGRDGHSSSIATCGHCFSRARWALAVTGPGTGNPFVLRYGPLAARGGTIPLWDPPAAAHGHRGGVVGPVFSTGGGSRDITLAT